MIQLEEHMDRLFCACPFGIFLVNAATWSDDEMRELSKARPGRILAVNNPDDIRWLPTQDPPTLGCVAGWISEDDAP